MHGVCDADGPGPLSDPRPIFGVRLKCLQNLVLMPIYCITARIIWPGYLKCAQSEPWQHFTTTIFTLTIHTTLHIALSEEMCSCVSVLFTIVTKTWHYLYITQMRVSHRGKSYPVNQIVIITVFASSSSDCFNSLIISNDQSSSRPMNEILAWQHLFVTTIILYVCYAMGWENIQITPLVVLQSLAKHSSSPSMVGQCSICSHVIYPWQFDRQPPDNVTR